MKKILVFGMMLVFLIALRSNANGAPSTVYVDDDWAGLPNGTVVSGHIIGTDAFASIQDAVNAVASGGTVYVWNGTYNENIDVTKSVSIIGNESASCIVKAADNADSVFWVNADQVTISGLNITGGSRGVLLRSDTDYCNVSNNVLYNNGWGIGVFGIIGGSTTLSYMADHNVIMNNTISHNEEGIWMYKAQYNKIKGNIISYNTNRGIHMDTYSRYNLIINNYIRNNQYGIRIEDSTPTSIDNQIYNNCIYHNTYNANDTCSNIWSISKTAGPNIVGGPWLGGNYWGDYVGTDVDGDGIGDTPYTIPDGDNQDQFPLTTSISNVNKNKYYLTIQDAIDDANDGEIVVVHDGVYRENVNIDKSITLRNGSKPVIDGMGGIAINITANNVTIEGFNITNSSCGIKCITSGLHILNNTLYNCSYGIVLLHSDHNYVYNNNISGVIAEDACGIYLDYVNDSTFINNSIFDYRMVTGSACGIYLGYSSNNTFDGVYIHKLDLAVQVDYGIYMKEANNNALEGIEICDLHGEYGYGIYIQNSDNNTFNDSYIHDIDSTEGYAFYSDEWGSNNSIYNMTVASYLTTISFTYGNGIALNGVDNPHSSTMASIRKYVEIYNMTTNSWINLTINYTDDDAYGVTEETIGLYHWNETTETWEEVEANLDTTQNRINANLTSFSEYGVFATEMNVSIHLFNPWNLITVPVNVSLTAKSLAELIDGCMVITRWDAEKQRYYDYIVGIDTPGNPDFDIEDGIAYFVGVKYPTWLNMTGQPIENISIALKPGLDAIGWTDAGITTAEDFGGNIDSCVYVVKWNETSQEFETHMVGTVPNNNFAMETGRGVFVYIEGSSDVMWYGGR